MSAALTDDRARFLGWIMRQPDRDRLLVGWLVTRLHLPDLEPEPASDRLDLKERVRRFELQEIERAIEAEAGNLGAAARRLGIDRSGIHRKRRAAENWLARAPGSG